MNTRNYTKQNIPAWEVLRKLEAIVSSNAKTMNKNSELAKFIIQTEEVSRERSAKLDAYNQTNNALSKKNIEYIDLHRLLLSFLNTMPEMEVISNKAEEYITSNDSEEANSPEHTSKVSWVKESADKKSTSKNTVAFQTFDEAYAAVIEERQVFDKDHPYFANSEFREKLLAHYISREEYEKCVMITEY